VVPASPGEVSHQIARRREVLSVDRSVEKGEPDLLGEVLGIVQPVEWFEWSESAVDDGEKSGVEGLDQFRRGTGVPMAYTVDRTEKAPEVSGMISLLTLEMHA
jgi:hypothetical protein